MYITFTDLAGKFQYVIPVVPEDVSLKFGADNETISTLSGPVRLVGSKKLTGISWSSFFPVNKKYNFVESNSLSDGWEYVNFFNTMCKYEIPVRVIVTEDKTDDSGFSKRTIMNTLVSIDDFEVPKVEKNKDIIYSISLSEFPGDVWDYLNTSVTAKKYFKELNEQSAARKILQQYGLLT